MSHATAILHTRAGLAGAILAVIALAVYVAQVILHLRYGAVAPDTYFRG